MSISLDRELECVKNAVLQAGKMILQVTSDGFETQIKADQSPLTIADLEANRILHTALMGDFPDYGWLSEETRDDPIRLEKQRVWIVDPLDGTREFTLNIPEYATSVALVDNGIPILAVIYNPCTDEMFEAVQGGGTKLNGQPVLCKHELGEKPLVEVSRSDMEKGRLAAFEENLNVQPCGSIAYKLARLSAGVADSTLSVTPKNEWDIAAGILLVNEASGKAVNLDGQPFVFNQPDTLVNGVIAANQQAYEPIKAMVDANRK